MNMFSFSNALKASAALATAALLTGFAAVDTAPTFSQQQAAAHATPGETCELEGATLTWGSLERWRAYISGSIAHGSWQLDGAEYELPNFVWRGGEGVVSLDDGAANLEFAGSVAFSGHEGLLQVTMANPRFQVAGDRGYLFLDLSSTKTTGEPDIDVVGALAAEFDLAGAIEISSDTFKITDAPGALTAEGAAAFGGFYDEGEIVDLLTITATPAAACDLSNMQQQNGASLPTIAWVGIGAGAVILATAAGVFFARRKS